MTGIIMSATVPRFERIERIMRAVWTVLAFGFILVLPDHQMNLIAEYEYDKKLNLVTIQLTEYMGVATDGNCIKAGELFHAICSQGYYLYVKPYRIGGWVPSRVNPMDVSWTKQLVEEDPRIVGGPPVKTDRKRKPEYEGPKGQTREYEVNGERVIIRSWD